MFLLGGLLATGAPWDVVQAIAWGRMAVLARQTAEPAEARREFFSPEERCGMCRLVDAVRTESSDASGLAGWLGKAPLLLRASPQVTVYAPTTAARTRFADSHGGRMRTDAPPVPPPRGRM